MSPLELTKSRMKQVRHEIELLRSHAEGKPRMQLRKESYSHKLKMLQDELWNLDQQRRNLRKPVNMMESQQ
jgi:hypothetical protein